MYRNIGQRIIYWLGQKVLVYDIWPNELLIYSNLRYSKLLKANKSNAVHCYFRGDRVTSIKGFMLTILKRNSTQGLLLAALEELDTSLMVSTDCRR